MICQDLSRLNENLKCEHLSSNLPLARQGENRTHVKCLRDVCNTTIPQIQFSQVLG